MRALLGAAAVLAPAGAAAWLLWPWVAASGMMILGLMLGDAVFN